VPCSVGAACTRPRAFFRPITEVRDPLLGATGGGHSGGARRGRSQEVYIRVVPVPKATFRRTVYSVACDESLGPKRPASAGAGRGALIMSRRITALR